MYVVYIQMLSIINQLLSIWTVTRSCVSCDSTEHSDTHQNFPQTYLDLRYEAESVYKAS